MYPSFPIGYMSHEHGEYDSAQQKWFCGYWMSHEEWMEIHDYAPSGQQSSPVDE